MKKILLLSLLAPALLFADGVKNDGLTLEKLYEIVLAENPSVKESLQRIAAAEAVVKQQRSEFLPNVTFNGNYGHAAASMHPDTNPMERSRDGFTKSSFGVTATWMIFDGFVTKSKYLGKKLAYQQSQELAEETRRLLIEAATMAFHQAQLAQQNVIIAEKDRDFNLLLESDAKKRFNAQVIPESEVNTFTIRALAAESAALKAKQNFNIACIILAELMAQPDGTLPDDLQPVGITFDPTKQVGSIDEEIIYALANRPDYLAMNTGIEILEESVKTESRSRLPSVFWLSQLNYEDREGFVMTSKHNNVDNFVGIAVKWDIFTGGKKTSKIQKARADMLAIEQKKEALYLSIRSALRQQFETAKTTLEIYKRQTKISELSKSVRDSVEKSYKAGATSITRLNEAQNELTKAEAAKAAAYIDHQQALSQLEIETGKILQK